MKQYIQYNAQGKNLCSVITSGAAPICERQIVREPPVDTTGMMVDLKTLELVPDPDYQPPTPTLSMEALEALLIDNGVLTKEDIDAVKS